SSKTETQPVTDNVEIKNANDQDQDKIDSDSSKTETPTKPATDDTEMKDVNNQYQDEVELDDDLEIVFHSSEIEEDAKKLNFPTSTTENIDPINVDKFMETLSTWTIEDLKLREEELAKEMIENPQTNKDRYNEECNSLILLEKVWNAVCSLHRKRDVVLYQLNYESYQLALAYEANVKEIMSEEAEELLQNSTKRLQYRFGQMIFDHKDCPPTLKEIFDPQNKNKRAIFWRQIRAGRKMLDLVKVFGVRILLLNYKDDENILQIFTKKTRQKIPIEKWKGFIEDLKNHEKYPAVEKIFEQQSNLPTPDEELPNFFDTNPQDTYIEIKRTMGTSNGWYSDSCLRTPLLYTAYPKRHVFFLESGCTAVLEKHKTPPITKEKNKIKIQQAIMFVAPIHRDKNHWVAYAGTRENSNSKWTWDYGDSFGEPSRQTEIDAVSDYLDITKNDRPVAAGLESSKKMPKQTDSYNCGVYTLEFLL
ncbi:hypothetical protein HK096_010471, partial [Nowakowskiella sp. JEL0078]